MKKGKDKRPTVEVPKVEAPTEEAKTPAVQDGTKVNIPGAPDGMSQHDKVLYASVIQHRKDEMIRNGGESAEKYNALTVLEDATIIDIAVTELVIKKNPSALILTANEKNYSAIQLLASDMGVTLPDFKSLPKPTKEQLKAAGIEAVPGQVVLKLEDKSVSKEAREQKQKEQKTIDESKKKDYMKDHTKIQNDEQLKEALGFQLVNPDIVNPIEKLITTAQFYRAYLEARSDKAEDQNAELERIHALTNSDLLQDIITMVPPTFVAKGFGDILGRRAHDANSVVPAFCMLKNCVTDRKTSVQKYSDEEIASLVRVLISWYVSSKRTEMSAAIKAKEENIKTLKKDAKANAKGIESEEKKIAGLKKTIEHFNEMLSLVTDPSFELADNFIAAMRDKEHKLHISAQLVANYVTDCYYKGLEVTELEYDSLLLNIQQHIGIIINMFSSTINYSDDYKVENLISFEPAKEEKPGEEEPKN